MSTPIIEAIRDYIKNCPALGELTEVNVDFLDAEVGDYSIEEVICNPVVRRFVDGSEERQFLFVFASRRFYSTDSNRQNIENLHLFDQIYEWLEQNNNNGVFPALDDGFEPISIGALTGGYIQFVSNGQQSARYQIQCKLTYKKKGL